MQPLLLADENIARQTVLMLRQMGYDVLSIAEQSQGIADRDVLALASRQSRWLITHDRDYGQLIFVDGCEPPPTVVYLRLVSPDVRIAVMHVTAALEMAGGSPAYVTASKRGSLRMRALPARP